MKNTKKRNIIIIIALIILYLLFKRLVWDKYIVNPSPSDALQNEEGHPAVTTSIDTDQKLAVLTLEDGFKIYAVSKGRWGWSISDQVSMSDDTSEKPFNTKEDILYFKSRNNEYDIILITTQDDEIDYFVAYDENNEKVYFNKTMNNDTNLYFNYSKEPLTGDITYEAYSTDDKLLYRE